MQCDGERFEESPFGESDAGRDGHETVFGDRDDVAEVAWVRAGAEEADVLAEVMAAGAAHGAVVAVDGGFEERAVSWLPGGDTGACGQDGTGGFMAEDHGEGAGGIADGAFREVVEVRATDTAEVDPDLDFAGARGRRGRFGNLEAVLSDELSDAHLFFKQVLKSFARAVDRAGHMRRSGSGGGDGFGRFGRPGGFAGNGDAGAEEIALIRLVLGDDAFGDWFGALEVRGGVKKSALAAAVQLGVAFGAGLREVEASRERICAMITTTCGHILDHPREARSGDIHGVARG